jgi:hypothetical protein
VQPDAVFHSLCCCRHASLLTPDYQLLSTRNLKPET